MMDPFPLFSLNPTLLEKVINKFTAKSYCRFQLTCRTSYSFIQDNRNICVHVDGEFILKYKKFYDYPPIEAETDIKGLYKTRLRTLYSPDFNGPRDFNNFCEAVKSHRITCTELRIQSPVYFGSYVLLTEECARLISTLKPLKVYLDSERSGRYEAILTSKTVKSVEVCLYPKEADLAVPQFLSLFEKIKIHVYDRSFDKDTYAALRAILHVLFSQVRPKLCEFIFEINWGGELPSSEKEFVEKLGDYCLKIEKQDGKILSGAVKLPENFPTGSSCHVNLYNNCYVEIKYSTGEEV